MEIRDWNIAPKRPSQDKNGETVSSRDGARSRIGHPASAATKDGDGFGIFMSLISNSGR
ncbi:hypothetical protein [Thiobacillus denitrificans]|uniref:hypothetical protein n=1 Tax=Thiobacillus denitrificans TaxID=36861 RepID=UPI0003A02E54|nr:hypothetical protein [Thiobacillus denitrificans]